MEQENDWGLFGLLTESFARIVGWPLPASRHDPAWLYRGAPFAVLAHNTDADPRFIYANITAQRLFGYDWDEFTSLHSRLSAPPIDRRERGRLLDEVNRSGFVTGYGGVRVSKSGRLFRIKQATVWELIDEDGRRHGQGAAFGCWSDIGD